MSLLAWLIGWLAMLCQPQDLPPEFGDRTMITTTPPHVRQPDEFTRVNSDGWDGPKSKCEYATALLYELGGVVPLTLIVVVCGDCDAPEFTDDSE